MKRIAPLVSASLSALVVGCSGTEPTEPPEPPPTTLRVILNSPVANLGAIRFTVSGPSIDTIVSPFRHAYVSRVENGAYRVLVVGALTAGEVATIRTLDATRSFVVQVEEAAQRGTYRLVPSDSVGLGTQLP